MSRENKKKIYLSLNHHQDIFDYLNEYFSNHDDYELLKKNDKDNADCCIVDENITIKSSQKLVYVPTLVNQLDCYADIQRLLRISEYNIFVSEKDALKILRFYGLIGLLGNKNIYFNDCEFYAIKYSESLRTLVYIDTITNESQVKMVENFLSTYENVTVVSPRMNNYAIINEMGIPYIVYKPSKYTFKQKFKMRYLMWIPQVNKEISQLLKKRVNQSLSGLYYEKLIYLFDTNLYTSREIAMISSPIDYVHISPFYLGVKSLNKTFQISQSIIKEKSHIIEYNQEYITDVDNPQISLNQSVDFYMIHHSISKKNDYYVFQLKLRHRSLYQYPLQKLQLYLEDCFIPSSIKEGAHHIIISFKLSINELLNLPAQNKLYLQYKDDNGIGFKKDIHYTTRRHLNCDYLKSKIVNIDGKTSFYLRQSLKNRLYLTVRLHNRTDSFIENFKINLAYYVSLLFRNKQIYLLYEKDSSRYEESASVVYEKLIDMNYNQAYFILDRNYPDIDRIDSKYRKNIIYKYTFKHYLYFFIAHVFLGSELMVHAMELRIMNRHVLRKIYSSDIHNVFLQHGVMYMISLDSASRKYFTPKKDGRGKFRVVTSSQEEARHFIELGSYHPDQIIISGLPKYDRNILYPDADKIVIMPTWRVWEYNQATTDFASTPYYKMLERIISGIKEEYLDYVIILPHPLFYKAAMSNDFVLKKYMRFNVKYDELLRETRILITDYSSIAYDAFYRGSRVLFYWEELNQCLEKYGKNTKLMLNKDNVFGDICYCKEDITHVLDDNYNYSQKEIYKERYNHLVQFHDGKNTERLIQYLQKEKIID